MKIFIFEDIAKLTNNWHSGGGLIVIAKNVKHVKELLKENNSVVNITSEEWKTVKSFILKNENTKPDYWKMPNAGCC